MMLQVAIHHPDAGIVEMSLGDGRQTFRWLAKALEARLSVFKTLRDSNSADKCVICAFKNASGELLNPFDMIFEHAEDGAEKVEVWAESQSKIEIDGNGDPVYPEWLSAAFVMSDEGRKWQSSISHFRENGHNAEASSNMVQVGQVTDGQGAISAFNVDVSNLDFARLGMDKNMLMKVLAESLRPSYAAICGLFAHFSGSAELGQEYGLTIMEFGRFLHYTRTVNYRLYKDDVFAAFKQVVPEDRAVHIMSRAEMLQAILQMGGGPGPATDAAALGDRLEVLAESTKKVWSALLKSHLAYKDEPKLQHILAGFNSLLKEVFTRWAAKHTAGATEMSIEGFNELVDESGVAETPEESNKVSAVFGAQMSQEEGWELSGLVFTEFKEALTRWAMTAIATDLNLPEKVRLTFEAVTDSRSYK
jgi:hypothetical protein